MFLKNSRYAHVRAVDAVARDGRTVKAIALRRLPAVDGVATVVKGNDQLDMMALRSFGDPTQFWRIADANSDTRADDLVAEPGRDIEVPTG